MEIKFNVLDRQFFEYQEEYENAVLGVLRSGWYILGPEVEAFEKEFAEYVGSNYAIGLNSGMDALTLAFRALGIGNGDEVIAPANTYIASLLGITENRAVPILVEPDEFYNIDADEIEKFITPKTKAILAVHLYGQSANIEKIKLICEKHNLYLVEDCAQSHGAMLNEKMTGSFGDIGCFSFYPTKNLGAFGDGGAIVTSDQKIAKKIRMLRNYGSEKKYYHDIEGVNSRLDELQASLLRVKLKNFEKLQKDRVRIASWYLSEIKNLKVILPKTRSGANHTWHLFVVRIEDRDNFQNYLAENGIQTMIHYPIPPHLSGAYKRFSYRKGDYKITEEYAQSMLSLPLYQGMTDQEISYVVKTINSFK